MSNRVHGNWGLPDLLIGGVLLIAVAIAGLVTGCGSAAPSQVSTITLPPAQQVAADGWLASVPRVQGRIYGVVIESHNDYGYYHGLAQSLGRVSHFLTDSGGCADNVAAQLAQLIHVGDGISWSIKGGDDVVCPNEVSVEQRAVLP